MFSAPIRFLLVAMACWLADGIFAQSTAETVSRLEGELKAVASDFAGDLKWTAEEPEGLLREEIKASAAKTLSSLDSLSAEINGATDIISKREADVSSGKLSQSEKKELLLILAHQKAPLVRLRDRISQVRKKIEAIEKTELDSWKQTYSAFESIKGRESAKEKLAGMMKASLSAVPLLAEGYANATRSQPVLAGEGVASTPVAHSKRADGISIGSLKIPVASSKPAAVTQTAQVEVADGADEGVDSTITLSQSQSFVAILGTCLVLVFWIFFLFLAGAKSRGAGSIGNIFCALNSLLLPGLGQIGQRRIFSGILFLVASAALWIVYMGWVIHLWSAVNAAIWKKPAAPPPVPE